MIIKSSVLFFTLSFVVQAFTQAPGVLDAHFISERHFTFIDQIEIGGEVWDDLYKKYSTGELNLEKSEDSLFIGTRSSGFYPYKFGLPYLHLFHEDDHWAVRARKTVDLKTSYHGVFWTEGPGRHYYVRESDRSIRTDTIYNYFGNSIFREVIEEGIRKDRITPYLNEEYDRILDKTYHLDSIVADSLADLVASADRMIINEDYFYNKYTGITGSQIISIGFFKGEQQLVWTYYPELKYSLGNNFLLFDYNLNKQSSTTYNQIFQNHRYDVSNIKLTPLRINNLRWKNSSDLQYLTAMNALFWVDMIKSYVQANYRNFSGHIKLPVHNDLHLIASLENGQIQGPCKLIDQDSNTQILVDFKQHIPHGEYYEYFQNGQVKVSGQFNMGLKTGEWLDFYMNGEKMAKRNYDRGWMNGEQTFWYENGAVYMVFNYKEFMLNGPFERFTLDGEISEKGFFTNNYPNKKWEINLKIPDEFVPVFKKNQHLEWVYPAAAFEDGILSYHVVLEQGQKEKNCPTPIFTCVSKVSMSEVK